MNKLSYQTLKEKEFTGYLLKEAPERVIQFGEGNFMRAFVDFFIDNMNEKADFNSKVVLVQPIAPHPPEPLTSRMPSTNRKDSTPSTSAAAKTAKK